MSDAPKPNVLHTRICDLFGCKFPVIQTGMGWVSGSRLTAATSEAGGLGILASATMTYAELESEIAAVKELTDKNFGVNFRADQEDIEKRIDLAIAQKVKVASFAQAPREKIIKKLKDAGLVVMPTIGAKRHAEKVAAWGVDAVIAQGHEGGGHTGQVPTSLLLPQVCDTVDIPVLGAGGFNDGRGLIAALSYGASGIAMGTRFLLTQESDVPDDHQSAVHQNARDRHRGDQSHRWLPAACHPYRRVEQLERSSIITRLFRALGYAFALRKAHGNFFRCADQRGPCHA